MLRADVAIVGFGYAGLATLLHLVRVGERRKVVVVARDASGLGLAYGTREAEHLLNVPTERMGALARDPENFTAWLATPAAASAAAVIGARLPGRLDYAPRVLYGSYLASLRDRIEAQAREREISITWLSADADDLDHAASRWAITAGRRVVEADTCVLAIGNERRHVFGELEHPGLHLGPWSPARARPVDSEQPIALIGSGLTAVDSILSLRSAGYRGEILALSRSGRFPAAHRPGVQALALDSAEVDRIRTLDDVLRYFREQERAGHDWRAAIDGLRPHTQGLWQRLSRSDQKAAIARWSSVWSVRRHRMAVEVAERIDRELRSGALSLRPTTHIIARVTTNGLALELQARDGRRTALRPAAVVDCVGLSLDCAQSTRPLLRNLLRRRICVRHHTGLGLATTGDYRIADNLYTLGSLLTGQLWETIAVPELRDQAASIAQRLADPSVRSHRPSDTAAVTARETRVPRPRVPG